MPAPFSGLRPPLAARHLRREEQDARLVHYLQHSPDLLGAWLLSVCTLLPCVHLDNRAGAARLLVPQEAFARLPAQQDLAPGPQTAQWLQGQGLLEELEGGSSWALALDRLQTCAQDRIVQLLEFRQERARGAARKHAAARKSLPAL